MEVDNQSAAMTCYQWLLQVTVADGDIFIHRWWTACCLLKPPFGIPYHKTICSPLIQLIRNQIANFWHCTDRTNSVIFPWHTVDENWKYYLNLINYIYILCDVTEKDTHGDVMWTWVYPSLSADLRQSIMRNCCLTWDSMSSIVPFVYTQSCKQWLYLQTESTGKLPKVGLCSIFHIIYWTNFSLL